LPSYITGKPQPGQRGVIELSAVRELVDISGRPAVPPSFRPERTLGSEPKISALQKPTPIKIAKPKEAVKFFLYGTHSEPLIGGKLRKK